MPGEVSAERLPMLHRRDAAHNPKPHLLLLDPLAQHRFRQPAKEIHEGEHVSQFLTSRAYGDLLAWILQLNAAMFPRRLPNGHVQAWELHSPALVHPPAVHRLQMLVEQLQQIIQEAPPGSGPRRFGNISFRSWHALVEERVDGMLSTCLDGSKGLVLNADARVELRAYLLGALGSAQRLDYGTGHELSFLAFLGGLWKLGYFDTDECDSSDGSQERSIVLGAIEAYLVLVRTLILTYSLEPAGSHGVWGLDDHAFVSYILGSAQMGPAITETSDIPQEGSLPGTPDAADVARVDAVTRERERNMYFAAIGFIYDVKKGPFFEHSPMLYDISGVTAGWAKINKGMIKMYIAEVLSKFPVVQHFPFGQLYEWEHDADAKLPAVSAHVKAQPSARPPPEVGAAKAGSALPQRGPGPAAAIPPPGTIVTKAAGGSSVPVTRAPWAK